MLYIAQERRTILDPPVRALAETINPESRVAELTYVFTRLCELSRSGATLPTDQCGSPREEQLRTKINSVARRISKRKRAGELGYVFTNLLLLTLPKDDGRYHAQNTGIISMALQQVAPRSGGLEQLIGQATPLSEEHGALMNTLLQYHQRVLGEEESWKRLMSGDLAVYAQQKKKTLYLSHPTKERFKVREEIQPQIEELGFRVINPFLLGGREHILFDKELMGRMSELFRREAEQADPEEMVVMELGAIRKADGVFAYVPYETTGTQIEIWYNSVDLQRGKPATFVLVDTTKENEHFLRHPWLLTSCDPSSDFEELKERLLRWKESAPSDGDASEAEKHITAASDLEEFMRFARAHEEETTVNSEE